ncbi:hypothetical protein KL918_002647 [Ogataea parapolymorpha]|uniref:FGGY-family pentulose kinase n=1 Tax=Ogataea parapolymorpha (strain ATCC 26012 / BCRC 20466 / JCM 22074 / NRRL Y-7560 / DL-1) TaxID=871575 RepID=W1QH91_OGAPD|nr:FGGY-family pentulose kinase [Ogataea parapolymorpha DL-1]ESX01006.1 FGGY-family pentulose kinase [Ogataea parapolymorpha DL-1]KAG7867208.1 hypothetical protein KL918_002647 [Ogataea parapolymorpha]
MSKSAMSSWYLGIDIGTSSLRTSILNDQGVVVGGSEQAIDVYYHPSNNRIITQNSPQLWSKLLTAIDESLQAAKAKEEGTLKSICCGATCSLVVEDDDSSHIILWMDHRGETNSINSKMETQYPRILQRLGGSIIAEMALPKIKEYLRKTPSKPRIFDLHDWIEWKLAGEVLNIQKYNTEYIGIDGSLKGFSIECLRELDIHLKESQIGRVENIPYPGIPFAGTPIAKLSPELAERWDAKSAVVCSGVIDCYASFFALQNNDISPEENLVMVAGTSTCYLTVSRAPKEPPPGIWGPFHLTENFWFYEGGLSCSGILFESLLENHPAAKTLDKSTNMFQQLEKLVSFFVESEKLSSAWQLIEKRLYIGDYLGNRTPFNDSNLSSVIIGGSLRQDTRDLVCCYLSILEYLALSTKMIVECFRKSGFYLKTLQVCGSQAKNARLMELLALILDDMNILLPIDLDSKLIGARGCSILGGCAAKDAKFKVVKDVPNDTLKKLFDTKYVIMFELIEKQQDFNRRLASCTTHSQTQC